MQQASHGPGLRASQRMEGVQAPIIPIVAQLIRSNPGTISLGQGVVAYPPPPEAFAALQDFMADPQNHKYKPVEGLPLLLDEITRKLRADNGINVDEKSVVVVTAGGNMAFMNALLAIADPGDEIILQTPYYFNHEMAVTMANCTPVLVPTDADYQLQPDLIERAITSRTRAVVTISPNNPTGAVYSEGALAQVNQLCAKHGIFHIHDEAYEYFTYDGALHFSPGSLPGSSEHTISLFSLSKSFGFASWRIGYMLIPGRLAVPIRKIQDTILICAPVISQFAAAGALKAGRAFCQKQLVALTDVRQIVRNALEGIADFCFVPLARGAFYFLLRIAGNHDPMKLTEALVSQYGVAVIPGTAFGMREGCYLRVSYGPLERETASLGIDRLVRGLKGLVHQ